MTATIISEVKMRGTNAQRLAYGVAGVPDNQKIYWEETDTGDSYELIGASWSQTRANGAAKVTQATLLAGEPGSGQSLDVVENGEATIIDGTSAVTLGGGMVNDAVLLGVVILQNATAVTATVGGIFKRDATGAEVSSSYVLTGSTTDDKTILFGAGMKNRAAALTITASVDEKVIAIWRDAQ